MNTNEEKCLQEILDSIYAKLDITEEIFNASLQTYLPEHPKEVYEITKLTQESMLQLKYQYYGEEVPELPIISDEDMLKLDYLYNSIDQQLKSEFDEIEDATQKEEALVYKPILVEDQFFM